ncbi:MAG: hypothetical protein Q9165_005910 [Trypethelium subeluteriae]
MHLTLLPATPFDIPSYLLVASSAFANDPLRALLFPTSRFDPTDPHAGKRFRLQAMLKRAHNPQVRHLKVVDQDEVEDVSALGGFRDEVERRAEELNGVFGGPVEGLETEEGVARSEGGRRRKVVGQAIWIAPSSVEKERGETKRDGDGDREAPVEQAEEVAGIEKTKVEEPGLPHCLDATVLGELREKTEMARKRVMGGRKDYWYLASMCTRPEYQGNGVGSMMLKWGIEQASRAGKDVYLEATPAGASLYRKHGFVAKDAFTMNDSEYTIVSMVKEFEQPNR